MKVAWTYPDFGQMEKKAIQKVAKTGWVTMGRETVLFEEEIAKYIGVENAVVMNNGTSALIASLLAEDVGRGDEVIVPSYTFIATVNSIISVGAKPVLIDSDISTWAITPEEAEKHINKKTKAIMPVDIAGMTIDTDGFRRLAKKYHLALIEDAASGLGAENNGKKVGSFGHLTTFSFHMAKPVTSIEGGCVTTGDRFMARKLRQLRNHGMTDTYNFSKHGPAYQFEGFGLNLRTNDISSTVGRVQLSKIQKFLDQRHKIAEIYKNGLGDSVEFQVIPSYSSAHANMFFAILVAKSKRDLIIKKLHDSGIDTRINWIPAHLYPWHRKYFGNIRLKNAEEIGSRNIALPIGNKMTLLQAKFVVDKFKKILNSV